ncbi:Uncharacterised protein [Mycobacterium tuberculosis]|nr:Uncharacterised protein [Mycobacterium tuberculosis]
MAPSLAIVYIEILKLRTVQLHFVENRREYDFHRLEQAKPKTVDERFDRPVHILRVAAAVYERYADHVGFQAQLLDGIDLAVVAEQ